MSKLTLLHSIIQKHKTPTVNTEDDVVAASKILDFIEKSGAVSLATIRKSLWHYASQSDTERILATFVAHNVVEECVNGRMILYRISITRR